MWQSRCLRVRTSQKHDEFLKSKGILRQSGNIVLTLIHIFHVQIIHVNHSCSNMVMCRRPPCCFVHFCSCDGKDVITCHSNYLRIP